MIIISQKLKSCALEAIVFSPSEQVVLDILGRRKMTIEEVTLKFYGRPESEQPPMEPHNYIGSVVRRIEAKAEFNDLPWRIKGKRDRRGRTVWKETVRRGKK